jgi:hypothetical protein
LYPTEIVFEKIHLRGGIARFNIYGDILLIYSFFFFFTKILYEKSKFYDWIIILLLLGMIALRQTRMTLITLVLTPILIIFINRKLPYPRISKIFLVIIIILIIILTFALTGLAQATIKEINLKSGNIYVRINAAKFYLENFCNSIPTVLFGNGFENQKESFGQEILKYKEYYGFYPSDIGYIGYFFHYGLLSLLTIFIIIFKGIRVAYLKGYIFLEYLLVYILISSITYPTFENSSSILILCIILYLLEINILINLNGDNI